MHSFRFKILLFSVGFTSILAQLLIIRDFLNVFDGNELVVGLFMCIWMMLTAAGSFAATRKPLSSDISYSAFMLLVISLLPSAVIAVLYSAEALLFPPGTEHSLPVIMLSGIIILLPVCFVSGRLFTQTATSFSYETGKNSIAASYGWESSGGILAGLLFITPVPFMLSTFQLVGLISLFNLIVFYSVTAHLKRLRFLAGTIVLLYCILALFAEKPLQQLHFRQQQLLQWINTPYGNISVTRTGEQYNMYLNSSLVLFNDPYYYEEPVHFELSQISNPENILILSGGIHQVREALKYPSVQNTDYVDINPILFHLNQKYSEPFINKRKHSIIDDPRFYISNTEKKYDALIVNAPDPSTAQINRFFTKEFFVAAKRIMSDGGVFGISLSSSGNYMNDEALQLNGIIKTTLNSVFKNVTVIQGQRNYYMASDSSVTARILDRLGNEIPAEYVNASYFDDDLLAQRSEEILSQIERGTYPENSDRTPIAYFVQIGYVLKKSGSTPFLIAASVLFVSVVVFMLIFRTKGAYYQIFSAAFAASAAQFLLIFIYQVLYGNMYRMLGVIIAFYMAGLVLGSLISAERLIKKKRFVITAQAALILAIAALGLFADFVVGNTFSFSHSVKYILLAFSVIIAFAFALLFNSISRITEQSLQTVAGNLYGIDLIGSATGIVLISLVFLPLFGLPVSCFIIASIVAVFSFFSSLR